MKLSELLNVVCFTERLRIYDISNYCFLQIIKNEDDEGFKQFEKSFKDCDVLYFKPEYDKGYLYLTIRIGCEFKEEEE